jgi:hypothetical protein
VTGLGLGAIASVFGDPREGGRRDHHGVDIFSARGTPVVAAVDGVVRVSTSNLGGQVIWLTGRSRRGRLYYAHLDNWAVADGAAVRAGDVIGYVGNTGNARTTPPHLHFGVYDRGPVDPVPFLAPDDPRPREVATGLDAAEVWARVASRPTDLRAAPSSGARSIARLTAHQVIRVHAAVAGYYRVALPNGTAGFVAASSVEAVTRPLEEARLGVDQPILEAPSASAPVVDNVGSGETVEVLGWSDNFGLVRRPGVGTAWFMTRPSG